MRPVTDRQLERDVRNRDVMLCLDVSTSMNELDAIVLRQFAELAAGLRGERIGLTIFNGSAITVFPLTDDAEFIETDARRCGDIARPTQAFVRRGHRGGRHVVDRRRPGLVRDALRLRRSRAVTLDRLRHRQRPRRRADPASSRRPPSSSASADIRVYAIAAADRITDDDAAELRAAAESTGGAFFETDGRSTTADVVAEIGRLEASRLDVPPEVSRRRPADDVDRRLLRRPRRPVRRRMGAATMSDLTFDPLVPWPLLVALVVGGAIAVCVWVRRGTPTRPGVVRWSAMGVCSCSSPPTRRSAVAGRRSSAPMPTCCSSSTPPGAWRPRTTTATNRGSSASATTSPALADEFSGAHFALVTFNSKTRVIVPWTTDRGALDSAAAAAAPGVDAVRPGHPARRAAADDAPTAPPRRARAAATTWCSSCPTASRPCSRRRGRSNASTPPWPAAPCSATARRRGPDARVRRPRRGARPVHPRLRDRRGRRLADRRGQPRQGRRRARRRLRPSHGAGRRRARSPTTRPGRSARSTPASATPSGACTGCRRSA